MMVKKIKYIVNLPKWNKDLAYFCGLIIGDGSLPKGFSRRPNGKIQKRHEISFVSVSVDFIINVYQPLFEKLFGIKPYIVRWKDKYKRKELFYCRIESKNLYNFLIKKLGMISGKKARIASPLKMPEKYKIYFLAGLLDTDGGHKGSAFGFSTASKNLAIFVEKSFLKLKLKPKHSIWNFNNYDYHQIRLNKTDSIKILNTIPLKNKEKISFIKQLCPGSSAGRALDFSANAW